MLSDGIWECAETAFSEFKSVKLLTDFLKKEGFTVNSPAFGIEQERIKGTHDRLSEKKSRSGKNSNLREH